jgi:Zn-finger nucleic acid-binding protein
VEFEVCCPCTSALLKQPDLARVLDSVTVRAVGNIDPDAELIAPPHRTNIAACPHCHELMEKADYCAAKLVFFDRCISCELLWVTRDQLEAMALLWARMDARRARTKAKLADDLAVMDALFYVHKPT